MYRFLQLFLAQYPKYARLPFYIIGESYGGHYVPSLAARIVEGNRNTSNIPIKLSGVGVGNGWVDPYNQYAGYGPFAYENNLIDQNMYTQMNQTVQQCQNLLNAEDWDNADAVCSSIMNDVLQEAGNINYYDIKLHCNPPPLCYNFDTITNYLNLPAVKQKLGVSQSITWQACSGPVNMNFGIDRLESFAYDIPVLLANRIPVLIYSGKLDLICNYVGGFLWINALLWPQHQTFVNTPLHNWRVAGSIAGETKTVGPLTWLQIENAGHMVPHDQPSVSLTMLQQFLNGQPF